ncbi:MAG: hypothetical protein HUK21_08585 [Fibrobacteraceae bacterium]|nr:hypothetical protein [Fibrobacteraceae bacterium]
MYNKVVLYASYQTGDTLPGYVQFALKHLAESDFHVVLCTNERSLAPEVQEFLTANNIELFPTLNHGFDFGMWRRYLLSKTEEERQGIQRLLLINDSIVFYQNNFPIFFEEAEAANADAVSLTSGDEGSLHLQSFFLYLKSKAIPVFYSHVFETPEAETFYEAVEKLEVALTTKLFDANCNVTPLFATEGFTLFAYPSLILQGAGFVKRKLLQRRFSFKEKMHFVRHGGKRSLNINYHKLIIQAGLAEDFKEEYLPRPVDSCAKHALDLAIQKVAPYTYIPADQWLYNHRQKKKGVSK